MLSIVAPSDPRTQPDFSGDVVAGAGLIGTSVRDADGRRVGEIMALIHRRDACDVLVEQRRFLRRRRVHRIPLAELVGDVDASLRYVPGAGRLSVLTGEQSDDFSPS